MSAEGGQLRKVRRAYVNVPSTVARDSRLSFRARGVLVYLLDKPDGWRVRAESIAADGQEGRVAVQAALRELAERGYYRRVIARTEDRRRLTTITEVSDEPVEAWATRTSAEGGDSAEVPETEAAPDMPDVCGDQVCGSTSLDAGPVDATSCDALSTTEKYHREVEVLPPNPQRFAPGESCSESKRPHANCRGCGTTRRAQRAAAEAGAWPAWCGVCSEATRMGENDDGLPYRCPACHPMEVRSAAAG